MRQVPDTITEAWMTGRMEGDRRPMARVVCQQIEIRLFRNDQNNVFAQTPYLSSSGLVRELPNVKSVQWDRSADSPIAEATIELWNTVAVPIGASLTRDLDRPGYLTYNYGGTSRSSVWGHTKNEWSGLLMPDNALFTYEGYGVDPTVRAEDDPHLVLTGCWLIDEVEYTHDGRIVARCRDFGRTLADHILFPPVVPFSAGPKNSTYPKGAYSYPITFSSVNDEPTITTTKGDVIPYSPKRTKAVYDADSNYPWNSGKPVFGHDGHHAFDGNAGSYWLSIGNLRGDQGYSFEWIQGRISKQAVSEVRFRTKYTGYRAYLCLYADGKWQGSHSVPYDPNNPASAPNGSNTRYVRSTAVTSEDWTTISLPTPVENVTKVRITLGSLPDTGLGTYQHRAAVREVQVYGGQAEHRAPDTVEKIRHYNKNYSDYTDIIKLLLAWGGFFWDRNAQHLTSKAPDTPSYVGGGSVEWQFFGKDDPFLRNGRIWGDLQKTGTAGPAELGPDIWDKKPIIEGIEYIKDIVGFVFFIDEHGGAYWRLPNIFQVGNWWRTPDSPHSGTRTRKMVTIDERHTLIGLRARLSSRNVRERTFISSTDGKTAAMAVGWNPNPRAGFRRIGGWTDQGFETTAECQRMADMIALRQLFTYRTDTVTIAGYPALQVDDQIRIFEETSSEGFIHYITGMSSVNDLEAGEWTYNLDTHWLGDQPFKQWVFDPNKLAQETQRYLQNLFAPLE